MPNDTSSPTLVRLSKSKFTKGLQCHRYLWWSVHDRDAPELETDPQQQARFDEGARVGEIARDHVPGGVLIDFPYDAVDEKIDATRSAIQSGAKIIYEASFREDDIFVAIDVLHRASRGWILTEVKSATKVKDENHRDAAVQTHVAKRAGLDIVRTEIMHLNAACRFPDLSNLFTRTDVTEKVAPLLPDIQPAAKAQLAMLRESQPPDVEVGDHCTTPYDCPFMGRCWGKSPEHHVGTLYRLSAKKRKGLEADGYQTIDQIPPDFDLSDVNRRQRAAVISGEIVVEPGLSEALADFAEPVVHLDFETINPAIPVWNGCWPYGHVPVQFSCHTEVGRGKLHHADWLADGSADPRRALARALIDAVRGAGSIVVYNETFEEGRIRELRDAVPEYAAELDDVIARVRDLLPVVRNHVYHTAFGGSFSLKTVAPALVPNLTYGGLEISDGMLASNQLKALLLGSDELTPAERKRIRAALLAYCKNDTLATVGVLRRLRELASSR